MLSKPIKNIYTCFPGGKHKVLTMSYDDGRLEDRRLVEIFNRYGIRGTFNLNAGLADNPNRIPKSEWQTLYKNHEIACHTYLHPTIARCPIEQVARQIMQDRTELEEVTGAPVRGLAYPNGSYNQKILDLLPLLGIRYARVVPTTGNFEMPENWYIWKATCHHNQNLLECCDAFLSLKKTQYLYMMYVWGHSYQFPDDDNWDMMEEFCQKVGGNQEIWYATNIEIVDYLEAASRLQFTAAGDRVFNPSACSIWLEVDGEKKEVPGGKRVAL